MSECIGFLGAGHMASALVGGLLARGQAAESLILSDPLESALVTHSQRGCRTTTDNAVMLGVADVVVLAVKPQMLASVLAPQVELLRARRPLILSIVAGATIAGITQLLGGGDWAIVRAMPNTPALVQAAATGYYCSSAVTAAQRQQAQQILAAVGLALRVEEESLIDAVTAVSGSGPAYFFIVMQAMQRAGEALGLDARTARALTLQTALGAAQMAVTADVGVEELRRRVTSPGGTTQAAIAVLEEHGLMDCFEQALVAAHRRAGELGRQLQESAR